MVESHRARLDELLRRVQQIRDVLPPATDQHLLDALGAQEIQATAHLETVQDLVAWTHREGARAVRSLGMDARTTGLDEKSGVNREVHAPFRGSPGVRSLRATRLRVRCVDGAGVPEYSVRTLLR